MVGRNVCPALLCTLIFKKEIEKMIFVYLLKCILKGEQHGSVACESEALKGCMKLIQQLRGPCLRPAPKALLEHPWESQAGLQ